MRYTINVKKSFYNIFEYLIALVLVIRCCSIWMNESTTRLHIEQYMLILLTIAVVGCLITQGVFYKKNIMKGLIVLSSFLLYMFIFIILNNFNVTSYLKLVYAISLLIIYYFFCVYEQKFPSVLVKYENIIIIVAIISLVFWIFGTILGILKPSGTVYMNWTGSGDDIAVKSYHNLYYEIQTIKFYGFPSNIYRNTAIFVEAPMSSLHFSIALLIELFLKNKASKSKCILLTIAVISTVSTTGYIVLLSAYGAKRFLCNKGKGVYRTIRFFVIPIILAIIIYVCYKLVMNKLGSSSGSVRIDDFIAGFKAWKRNIIMGAGYDNYRFLRSYMGSWRSFSVGMSNSIMVILAECGIYIALIYIVCFAKGIYFAIKGNRNELLCFTTAIMFLFTVTVIPYQYLLVLILIFLGNSAVFIRPNKTQI